MTAKTIKGNSIKMAADTLQCSERTVQKLLAERALGHSRVGRRVVITDAHIEEFLKRNEVPAIDADAIARQILGA
jgi:excisionase family DNA binding protein